MKKMTILLLMATMILATPVRAQDSVVVVTETVVPKRDCDGEFNVKRDEAQRQLQECVATASAVGFVVLTGICEADFFREMILASGELLTCKYGQ